MDSQKSEWSVDIEFQAYEPGFATVLIVNNTHTCDMKIGQTGVGKSCTVPTRNALYYTWEDPAAKQKSLTFTLNGEKFTNSLLEVGRGKWLAIQPC